MTGCRQTMVMRPLLMAASVVSVLTVAVGVSVVAGMIEV